MNSSYIYNIYIYVCILLHLGWKMNCISIIYIWKELNEKYEFEKLSTGRLTQVYMFNILYIL